MDALRYLNDIRAYRRRQCYDGAGNKCQRKDEGLSKLCYRKIFIDGIGKED
ncbi:unnamed protein product [Enterobius vermicularis]|uniref:Lysozyme n=1 Tax=Enterobius vermicularis TaxID=51028 RepID=A0A0N4VPH9_ENTVE|nr:unnamed protein product [Enterobius vermicularis]